MLETLFSLVMGSYQIVLDEYSFLEQEIGIMPTISKPHDNYIYWLQNNSGIPIPIPVHVNLLKLISRGVYTAPINTSMDTCTFYNMVASGDGPETSL